MRRGFQPKRISQSAEVHQPAARNDDLARHGLTRAGARAEHGADCLAQLGDARNRAASTDDERAQQGD
jgi:hypothetical protein